jgi:hypothetical protein
MQWWLSEETHLAVPSPALLRSAPFHLVVLHLRRPLRASLKPRPHSWKLIYFDAYTSKAIYFSSIKIEMTTVARLLVVKAGRLVASPNQCFRWGAHVSQCVDEVKY